MKKILGLALAGALSVAALPTMAADRPLPYKAPPPVDPIFTWTGFYIGAHAGADWFNKDWFCSACILPATAGTHSDGSWLAGAQAGFNYQVGMWVWGLEAQFSWTRLEGSNVNLALPFIVDHSKTNYIGTAAARLGVAWNRTLLYVKGGAAWAHDTFFTSTPGGPCGLPVCQTATDTRWGWMAGVGVEYALSPNWSIKLEYDYLGFGRASETLNAVPGCACVAFPYDIKQSIQLVKAGINYRFGTM